LEGKKISYRNHEVRVRTGTRGIIRIEVKNDFLKLTIPKGIDPMFVIRKNRDWIDKHLSVIEKAKKLSYELKLLSRTNDDFRRVVRNKIEAIGSELSIKPRRVVFRYMKSKWGSWSRNRIITLNSFLRFLPERLIGYVVTHELLHFIEPFHTEEFYALLEHYFPDSERCDVELLAYWMLLKRTGIVEKHIAAKSLRA
jgi:hypothetical protein